MKMSVNIFLKMPCRARETFPNKLINHDTSQVTALAVGDSVDSFPDIQSYADWGNDTFCLDETVSPKISFYNSIENDSFLPEDVMNIPDELSSFILNTTNSMDLFMASDIADKLLENHVDFTEDQCNNFKYSPSLSSSSSSDFYFESSMTVNSGINEDLAFGDRCDSCKSDGSSFSLSSSPQVDSDNFELNKCNNVCYERSSDYSDNMDELNIAYLPSIIYSVDDAGVSQSLNCYRSKRKLTSEERRQRKMASNRGAAYRYRQKQKSKNAGGKITLSEATEKYQSAHSSVTEARSMLDLLKTLALDVITSRAKKRDLRRSD